MPPGSLIKGLHARWVLDSRGNPTVEVDCLLEGGSVGRAAVPSGASTGAHEAVELRDGDPTCFAGMSVDLAVDNVNGEISRALAGRDAADQWDVDDALLELDGTENKSRLGANAVLGASLAVARAAALARDVPLYRHLREVAFETVLPDDAPYLMPLPMANVFNGGKHGGGSVELQEFMFHPLGASSYSEGLRWIAESYQHLRKVLVYRYGPVVSNVGDEGGFSGPVGMVDEILEALIRSMEECGYIPGDEFGIAIDAASSEFYDKRKGLYTVEGSVRTPGELIDFYRDLVDRYPITSIEDPLDEDDFEGHAEVTKALGDRVQIVGDDHFATNPRRLELGIRAGSCNALLLKVNQIGTLSEAVRAARMCYENDYGVVVSHRSGETEDTTIADLAVALCCGQIKTGAPARGERTAKYNRLLRIDEELGGKARFDGRGFRRAHGPSSL